ncbi:hypothetical protein KBI33_02190 [Candidatus Shapirobacteria bacterium]|nr:hypothetical protein [Candidatus Shapirobacteria bacterium]
MVKKFPYVINLAGQKEPFSWEKVFLSARRAGSSKELAKKIADEISLMVYPGIPTALIHEEVLKHLHKQEPKAEIRFSLKKAIQRLGPTGFPFEKYVGALFEAQGWEVSLNQSLKGYCLTYEIDFLAEKEKEVLVGECKFRQTLAKQKINTEIILANYAKFLDLKKGKLFKTPLFRQKKVNFILVSDAKFTSQTQKFARCYQLKLLGWRYPEDRGLEHLIESQNLYPVTILPSLDDDMARHCFEEKIILVKDLLRKWPDFTKKVNLSLPKANIILEEAKILLD